VSLGALDSSFSLLPGLFTYNKTFVCMCPVLLVGTGNAKLWCLVWRSPACEMCGAGNMGGMAQHMSCAAHFYLHCFPAVQATKNAWGSAVSLPSIEKWHQFKIIRCSSFF
jgi:hypothetical protein